MRSGGGGAYVLQVSHVALEHAALQTIGRDLRAYLAGQSPPRSRASLHHSPAASLMRQCNQERRCLPVLTARVFHCNWLTLVPAVRVTRVLPTLRVVKVDGALTSYQSFFEKGSTLQKYSTGA